jgi:hypothetical protein
MPVTYRLLPRRNLVVVSFSGLAGLQETLEGARAAARQPAFRSHMRHLVDLRAVTGWERDFPGFMALQAQLMDIFHWRPSEALVVAIAPHRPAKEMSGLVARSWEGLDGPILRVVTDEEQALALLGLREGSLAELLAGAE